MRVKLREKASGLVEVLVALTLLSLAILSAVTFQTQMLRRLNQRGVKFRRELDLYHWQAIDLSEGLCSAAGDALLLECSKEVGQVQRRNKALFWLERR